MFQEGLEGGTGMPDPVGELDPNTTSVVRVQSNTAPAGNVEAGAGGGSAFGACLFVLLDTLHRERKFVDRMTELQR